MFAEYFGVKGFWQFGRHSFACLTSRRIAKIEVGFFGEVDYQDGYLEHINRSTIHQPAILGLISLTLLVVFLTPFLIPLILLPFVPRLYYRYNKSGLELWIRESESVEVFINRNRLIKANRLSRKLAQLREEHLSREPW